MEEPLLPNEEAQVDAPLRDGVPWESALAFEPSPEVDWADAATAATRWWQHFAHPVAEREYQRFETMGNRWTVAGSTVLIGVALVVVSLSMLEDYAVFSARHWYTSLSFAMGLVFVVHGGVIVAVCRRLARWPLPRQHAACRCIESGSFLLLLLTTLSLIATRGYAMYQVCPQQDVAAPGYVGRLPYCTNHVDYFIVGLPLFACTLSGLRATAGVFVTALIPPSFAVTALVFGRDVASLHWWRLLNQGCVYAIICVGCACIAWLTEREGRRHFLKLVQIHVALRHVGQHRDTVLQIVHTAVPRGTLGRLVEASSVAEATVSDDVERGTVIASDVFDFGRWSTGKLPAEVVAILNELFTAYDAAAQQLRVTKATTYGDVYVACTGLHERRGSEAAQVQRAGRMALHQVEQSLRIDSRTAAHFQVRVTVVTGGLFGGLGAASSLRYVLAGPAFSSGLRLLARCPPGTVAADEATMSLLMEHHGEEFHVAPLLDPVADPAPMTEMIFAVHPVRALPVVHGAAVGTPALTPALSSAFSDDSWYLDQSVEALSRLIAPRPGAEPRGLLPQCDSDGDRTASPEWSVTDVSMAERHLQADVDSPPKSAAAPPQPVPPTAAPPAALSASAPPSGPDSPEDEALAQRREAPFGGVGALTEEFRRAFRLPSRLFLRFQSEEVEAMYRHHRTAVFDREGWMPMLQMGGIVCTMLASVLAERVSAFAAGETTVLFRHTDPLPLALLGLACVLFGAAFVFHRRRLFTWHIEGQTVYCAVTAIGLLFLYTCMALLHDTFISNDVHCVVLLILMPVFYLTQGLPSFWVALTMVLIVALPGILCSLITRGWTMSLFAASLIATSTSFGLVGAFLRERSFRHVFAVSQFADACASLAAQRLAVQMHLLHRLLPAHVVAHVMGQLNASPGGPQPQLIERWANVCVVNLRANAGAANAAALQALHGTVASVVELSGGGVLQLVQALGDSFLIAGPLHRDGMGSHHQRDTVINDAAHRAVELVRALRQATAAPFTAVLECEDAFGALLGANLLSYRLFGVAVRTSSAILDAAPAMSQPLAIATRSFRQAYCALPAAPPATMNLSRTILPAAPDDAVDGVFGAQMTWRVRCEGAVAVHHVRVDDAPAPFAPLSE